LVQEVLPDHNASYKHPFFRLTNLNRYSSPLCGDEIHHKTQSTKGWSHPSAVLPTVMVRLVTYQPLGVKLVISLLGVQFSGTSSRALLKVKYLNITANFFVYSLTIESFREFLKRKTSNLISWLFLLRSKQIAPSQYNANL
jgi:hypothetical protein